MNPARIHINFKLYEIKTAVLWISVHDAVRELHMEGDAETDSPGMASVSPQQNLLKMINFLCIFWESSSTQMRVIFVH